MNKSPTLIVILIKYEGTDDWHVFHVAEEPQLANVKMLLYHCRAKACELNTNEKFKLEFYEPSK